MINYNNNAIDILSLNHRVSTAPAELVELSERNYHQQLKHVVKILAQMDKMPHFLLLAGPSASSKTTTAHKISSELAKISISSRVISLDDFYVDRKNLPLLPNGDVDYETINTLDLKLLSTCLNELINTKKSNFPIFDFNIGARSHRINPVTINDETILILEGLHALNPIITEGFTKSEFVKLYISPTSDYFYGNDLILAAREIRLMRRIIRDHFHRSSPIGRTMEMWTNVVIAEVDTIIPFAPQANFIIDSTIIYEPCVYKEYLIKIIGDANNVNNIYKKQVLMLKKAVEHISLLHNSFIPIDTVLHEFIK